MPLHQYFDILRNTRLFNGIGEEELEKMMKCLGAYTQSYAKGDFIYSMGDTIDTFGMVLTGSVCAIREDFWGNRTLIFRLAPGELFGEAYSFARHEPLLTSIVADAPTTVLFMNIATFTRMCKNTCTFHRSLIENMLGEVAEKNLMLTRKIRHTSQRSTRDKLLSYLSEQAHAQGENHFTIPFNRQELADYLCVDRSAMSQELSKMKRDGLVDYERNSFTLLKDFQ